jgi:hypothetical protein
MHAAMPVPHVRADGRRGSRRRAGGQARAAARDRDGRPRCSPTATRARPKGSCASTCWLTATTSRACACWRRSACSSTSPTMPTLLLEMSAAGAGASGCALRLCAGAAAAAQAPTQAATNWKRCCRWTPANRVYRTTYATAVHGIRRLPRALALYRRFSRDPKDAELHLSIAHSLKTLGATQEAIDSYRAAAALRPRYRRGLLEPGNLKTYRFTDAEIARMRR